MEPGISASSVTACATAKENRYGKTTLFTRDIGWTIGHTGGAGSSMRTEMYTKDSGKTIRRTEMEFIQELTGQATLDNGLKIYSTVTVLKNGMMALHTRESTPRVSNMGRVNLPGPIVQSMKEISRRI
jgi:hypothetical protein